MGETERTENTPLDLREQLAAAFADDVAAGDTATDMPAAEVNGDTAAGTEDTADVSGAEQAMPESGAGAAEGGAVSPASDTPSAMPQASAMEQQMAMAMQMADRATQALRQMQEENARMRAAMEQQNTLNQEAVQAAVENKPTPQMPIFDASGWSYMDDDARRKASADFTAAMAEYMRSQMEGEIAPIKASFEEQREAAAKAAAINTLSGNERMVGFAESVPQIERILSKTPSLAAESNPELRYMLGYLLKRGYESMNTPAAEKPAADIAREAMANPEVMRLIEAERARAASEKNAGAVAQVATSGASNAPATPVNRPQNFEEARRMLSRSFGL